ncbi:MAG: ABC-F family ATP-binding cassette domain-containing protein [Lachnospiraceae bacterium]|nr:ABC-F family ATP-binding cassette domain-containing protein [Lachnospiraceae bacterium]
MILSCQNIQKSFGIEEVIKDATFNIEEREKVAIVGINGAGKSTLLKIIMKETAPDSGSITLAKGKTIGFLSQHQDFDLDNTIYNAVLETKQDVMDLERDIRSIERKMSDTSGAKLDALMKDYTNKNHEFEMLGGYQYRSEVTGIIKGLGFSEDDFDKNVRKLSGGQKTRVALCKLLVSSPDIIMLDEPTNHLDMNSIEWLENFLLLYKGTVIIVSHDRYFLDKIVTKVIDLEAGVTRVYKGNYTEFAAKKEELRNALIKQYLNQQREIKHQEEVIDKLKSFNREKSIKRAESREKALEKIERLDKPVNINNEIKLSLEPNIDSGKDVLTVTDLSKAFGDNKLFENLSFEVKKGERVALIGDNGTGKTTILKIINGIIKADSGEVRLGAKVYPGYYDQEQLNLDPDNTIYDEISNAYPGLTQTQVRNTCASFLFTADDVFKKIADLSGGEKGRVALAKLMLSECNFLLLDEPTNHLDIDSKEILENVLRGYKGTVFFISHDRYFINATATRILELTGNTLVNFIGNYDYYSEKRDELHAAYNIGNRPDAPSRKAESEQRADWQKQKSINARNRKIKKTIEETENSITETEEAIAKIDEEFLNPEISSNSAKLNELSAKRSNLETKLDQLIEKWEHYLTLDE